MMQQHQTDREKLESFKQEEYILLVKLQQFLNDKDSLAGQVLTCDNEIRSIRVRLANLRGVIEGAGIGAKAVMEQQHDEAQARAAQEGIDALARSAGAPTPTPAPFAPEIRAPGQDLDAVPIPPVNPMIRQ